jgi:hypothetical protein
MLKDFLERAVEMGADAVEIEYEDGEEIVYAVRGSTGLGIGSVPAAQRATLFSDLRRLKKAKAVTLSGQRYRLSFSERESFGETLYRIALKRG